MQRIDSTICCLGASPHGLTWRRSYWRSFFPASRATRIKKKILPYPAERGKVTVRVLGEVQVSLCQFSSSPNLRPASIQYFYEELLQKDKSHIDASTSRALVNKTSSYTKALRRIFVRASFNSKREPIKRNLLYQILPPILWWSSTSDKSKSICREAQMMFL